MTVAELIAVLQTMPQDLEVRVNDNCGGEIHEIYCIDYFEATSGKELGFIYDDPEEVIIQVNV